MTFGAKLAAQISAKIEEIVTKFGMVVIVRAGTNPHKFIYESDILHKNKHNISVIEDWIPNEISATRIRTALRRRLSVKYLLQDSVIEYILAHKLYLGNGFNNNNATVASKAIHCTDKNDRHKLRLQLTSDDESDDFPPSHDQHRRDTRCQVFHSSIDQRGQSSSPPRPADYRPAPRKSDTADHEAIWQFARVGGGAASARRLNRSQSADDGTSCWRRTTVVASQDAVGNEGARCLAIGAPREPCTGSTRTAEGHQLPYDHVTRHNHLHPHYRGINLDEEQRRRPKSREGGAACGGAAERAAGVVVRRPRIGRTSSWCSATTTSEVVGGSQKSNRVDNSSNFEREGRYRQRPIRVQSQHSFIRDHHQQQQQQQQQQQHQQQQPCSELIHRSDGSDIHKSSRSTTKAATVYRQNSTESVKRLRPPTASDALRTISLTVKCSTAVDTSLHKSGTMPEVSSDAPAAAAPVASRTELNDALFGGGAQCRLHLPIAISSHCGTIVEKNGSSTVAKFMTAVSTATTVTNGFRQFAGVCLTPETCV